ncbi:MAG: hypothetical protein ACOYT4_04890 [Nanoarchaeota archaeon]
MQIKLLESLIEEIAGANSEQIVKILFNKKDVNEFLIAKKLNLNINQIRNILYKLSALGLVSFTRKKDKRKGWYIYYWTLNTKKCLIKLEQNLMKRIEELNIQLRNREMKRYYLCKSCNIEVNEDTALEHDFTCNECLEVYELSSSEDKIREITSKIVRVSRELKVIQDELKILNDKEAKKTKKAEQKLDAEKKEKAEQKKKQKAATKKTSKNLKKTSKK